MPKKGKKGVDQRVKGNVKTASSSRMAELVGSGFVGFEAVSAGLAGSGEEGAGGEGLVGEEVPRGVGGPFHVTMKQLGKRDATTKLKALQEFATLCQKEPPDTVLTAITLWPLMYNKLSTDYDNRVREASHRAMRSCVEAVSSSFGPHLRGVMGCWVAGMCDPYGPAASAAQGAFAAVFSPAKQLEVFRFCFKAVWNYTEDVVLHQNADTFSDPKIVPPDERVQRYERAVVMSVYGLSLALQRLEGEELAERQSVWEPLLGGKKLWKLARHQNPYIRASVFTLIATLAKKLPVFVAANARTLCSLVLGSLSESEPVVAAPLWEAAQLLVTTVESWSEHVNVQKALVPGLWSLLSAGGHGSAKVMYPCLLPLLKKLVEQVFSSDVNFALSFLEKMRSGLQADRVRTSATECEIVMQTFCSCLLYLVIGLTPEESCKDAFHNDMLAMVVSVLDFALTDCPKVQCGSVYSCLVQLMEGLLALQPENEWLATPLHSLRENVTEVILALVGCHEKVSKLARIGELLKAFQTPKGETLLQTKTVSFADGGRQMKVTAVRPSPAEEFLSPVISAIGVACIVKVCNASSLKHSQLLSTILCLHGSDALVSSLLARLESECPVLVQKGREADDGGEGDEVIFLCTSLVTSIGLEESVASLRNERAKFSESVIENVVYLLFTGLVEVETAESFFGRIVQQHIYILPLLLRKLLQVGHVEFVASLYTSNKEVFAQLLTMKQGAYTLFLWDFLQQIFTKSSGGELFTGDIFARLCLLLRESLSSSGSGDTLLTIPVLEELLSVLSKAESSIVKAQDEVDMRGLLECLLQWCLSARDDSSSQEALPKVCSCYSHLLSSLEDPVSFLSSASSSVLLMSDEMCFSVDRSLVSAVVFHALHSEVLTTRGIFWKLHKPFVTSANSVEPFLPASGLEEFCQSSLLYSPLFKDMASTSVCSSLPHRLLVVLYPVISLCQASVVRATLAEMNLDDGSKRLVFSVVDLCNWRLEPFAASASGADEDEDGREDWRLLVMALLLTLVGLKQSQVGSFSTAEVKLAPLIESALSRTIQDGVDKPDWVISLFSNIVEKASLKGPLWCLALRELMTASQNILTRELMKQVFCLHLHDPEAAPLHATLSAMDSSELWQEDVLYLARERREDICLLMGTIRLIPENSELLSLGEKILSSVATQHSSSDIVVFESLTESVQDPFSFSLVELMVLLVRAQRVPSDAWDFILCSLVTLIQLISDSERVATVNHTVLYCCSMRLCWTVRDFLESPLALAATATEWAEFFQPSLADCLLQLLSKVAGESDLDCCNTLQQHALCKAVSLLCKDAGQVTLKGLVDMMQSSFFHRQVAAFVLAQRLIGKLQIVLEDDKTLESSDQSMSLDSIKGILSAAFDCVNLDLTFVSDDPTSQGTMTTTSYILLWMLAIEIMGRCSPEARGSFTEWLKELSLFAHFLHGLLAVVGDSPTLSGQSQVEVTLVPDMEPLCLCAYTAVARQLPSMLRQWYLSVDRQTSSEVNRFTVKHVSPYLQQSELAVVSKSAPKAIGNMEVRVCSGISEVAVVYRLDEFSIELFVCLPDNYPLQPPQIREGRRAKVDSAHWRKWMLQLNVFVTNQNGTLLDGLLLWKSNLDKHFSGVEDCMICFSVIHSSNFALPKMVCRTCKKKFHSACLYKWFYTSTKSTCPLCRNVF